jgi:hypothetical protein
MRRWEKQYEQMIKSTVLLMAVKAAPIAGAKTAPSNSSARKLTNRDTRVTSECINKL